MKSFYRLIFALYLGFALYTLLALFFGEAGVLARERLTGYRERLQENVTQLADIHDTLAQKRDALLHDPMEIQLRARTLGYFSEGDLPLQLPANTTERTKHTLGRIIRGGNWVQGNPALHRALGMSAAIVSYLFLSFFSFKKNGSQSKR